KRPPQCRCRNAHHKQSCPNGDKTETETKKNTNTGNKTRSHMKLIQDFLVQKGEGRPIQEIPPHDMDMILQEFVMRIRQRDESKYEPSSIRGITSSLDRQLMWGDIQLGIEGTEEFLEFNERQTKTRTGSDTNNVRRQKPGMYATGTERCQVVTYKQYADHRPMNFSGDDHPFYLAVVTNKVAPIGRNKLDSIMKKMAERAGLPALMNGKRLTHTTKDSPFQIY
ncbi:hypothetical protein MAR_013193, partial [Mya arenaria]